MSTTYLLETITDANAIRPEVVDMSSGDNHRCKHDKMSTTYLLETISKRKREPTRCRQTCLLYRRETSDHTLATSRASRANRKSTLSLTHQRGLFPDSGSDSPSSCGRPGRLFSGCLYRPNAGRVPLETPTGKQPTLADPPERVIPRLWVRLAFELRETGLCLLSVHRPNVGRVPLETSSGKQNTSTDAYVGDSRR